MFIASNGGRRGRISGRIDSTTASDTIFEKFSLGGRMVESKSYTSFYR